MPEREVLSDNRTVVAPFPASTGIDIGDLLWWDAAATVAKKASQMADLGSLVLDQIKFVQNFLGVAKDQRLASETSTGNDSRRLVALDGVYDYPCPSSTWEVGDLVGPDRDATPLLYNQQVIKVTNPALAFGVCVKREPSAVTKVRCRLTSRLMWSDLYKQPRGIGGFQGTGSTAMADADTTLTVASNPIQTGVPTAARKVILPAAAQSAGLMFFVVNNSAGAFALNIRDPGDTTTLAAVAQNKRGIAWCDGTTWFAGPFA